MKNDDKKSGDSFHHLVLIGSLLVLAIFYKVWPRVFQFWESHKVTLLTAMGLAALFLIVWGLAKAWNWYALRDQENGVVAPDATAVFLGTDLDKKSAVHLKQSFRTMHTQVIGTTNAGKTESVILPWAIQDINNGSGLLIVDGKSDSSFLQKLYAYAKKAGRENDFRLFSLAHPGPSSSFNPLKGAAAQEVTERVFSSFTFENEYYKNVQYRIFLTLVRLVFWHKETPTFSLIHQLLTDKDELEKWIDSVSDPLLKRELMRFLALSEKDREERTSGLETMLSHFTVGDVASLFVETAHSIDFDQALSDGQILYFQLPTMYFPFLASATGKLVLQCFQSAVSKRQIMMGGENEPSAKVLLMPAR